MDSKHVTNRKQGVKETQRDPGEGHQGDVGQHVGDDG